MCVRTSNDKGKKKGLKMNVKHYIQARVFETEDVARVNLYPVRNVGKGRKPKMKASTPCQQALNKRNSVKLQEDIIQLNFPRRLGGLHVGLDYNRFIDAFRRNPTENEWKAYLAQFTRRLKRLYKENGGELKMYKATQIGRKMHKTHHHLIISRPPKDGMWEAISALWDAGTVDISPLVYYQNNSIRGLANYISTGSGDCKWSCTRNCKRPSKEPYADGTPASVEVKDKLITMAQARYIDKNKDDHAYIARLFPGYAVSDVRVTPEPMVGVSGHVYGETTLFSGPFVEIELYKLDTRDKELILLGQKRE